MLDDLKANVDAALENLQIACHNYLCEKFGDDYNLDDGSEAANDSVGKLSLAISNEF